MSREGKLNIGDWIEDMVEVFTALLIVYPSGWEDTLPDWIKSEVTLQRLVRLMKSDDGLATDVEALAYMYPRTLEAPLDHDWTQIYLYLATRVMGSRLSSKGAEIPADIRVEQLDPYLEGKLIELKPWIQERQRRAMAERRKAERWQERAEIAAKTKAARRHGDSPSGNHLLDYHRPGMPDIQVSWY
jgi:hypothetical protein